MADWGKIRAEYETTDMTLKEISEKFGVKLGTLKSRKSRESWQRIEEKEQVATKHPKVATKREKVATEKEQVATIPVVIENDNLTEKQKMFCLYYLKYFNATKAYQKAYGCSYYAAKTNGNKLLSNTYIKEELEHLKAMQQRDLYLDSLDILQKYVDIAFADMTDFVDFGSVQIVRKEYDGEDEEGNPLYKEVCEVNSFVDLKESDEVDGSLITEVKQGRDGVAIKLADRMQALNKLWEYFEVLPKPIKEQLSEERLRAETELTKERVKQLQGAIKDTSKLDALIGLFNNNGGDE